MIRTLLFVLALLVVVPMSAAAQVAPYREGSVWDLSFIRVQPGMGVEATYTHEPFQTEEGPSGTSGRSTLTWTQGADGQWRIRSAEVMPDAPPRP